MAAVLAQRGASAVLDYSMTAIAALVHRRQVWMAGDSQVTIAGNRVMTADPKVWRVDMPGRAALVVGAAGDAVCDYVLSEVDWTAGPRTWRGRIAALARQYECRDLDALIGYKGRLYAYSDGALYTVEGRSHAIGSGGDYALGYLHASALPPAARVRGAVRGAAARDVMVGGKVRVVST